VVISCGGIITEGQGEHQVSEKVYQIYGDALALAIKMRQEFLDSLSGERKERAVALQKMISARLRSAGSINNRLVLIQQMMFDSLMELESELKDLRERLIQTRDNERLQEEGKYFIEEEEKSL
jgi:hypothetical protein